MREDFTGGAHAGAQCPFHEARPGPGGVLAGEMDPAQGSRHDLRLP
jgi:hypothetical protein